MIINGWNISVVTEQGFDYKYRVSKNGYEQKFYTLAAALGFAESSNT